MVALLATDDGVFRVSSSGLERVCCAGDRIYDVYSVGGSIYTCSTNRGVSVANSGDVLVNGSCWRLYPSDLGLVASIEGPRLYLIRNDVVKLLGDYRGYAERLGWWFPHGPPHITDFTVYRGEVLATVEVGHLLRGSAIDSLRPTVFREDQHNVLALNDMVLVATASGVYYTGDLERFELAAGSEGYFHALEYCGGILVGHVMDDEPLRVSRDLGRSWSRVELRLPPPTFGTTGLACLDGHRILYATTSVYIIDIRNFKVDMLTDGIPMTRRVVKTGSGEHM